MYCGHVQLKTLAGLMAGNVRVLENEDVRCSFHKLKHSGRKTMAANVSVGIVQPKLPHSSI